MRQLSTVLTTCVVFGSLALVGCSRPAAPAAAPAQSPATTTAAAPAVAPAQPATPTAAPAPAQLAEAPSAAVAPVVAVDRGPWGDPQWSGVNDAPALLDRVRARLGKEAPWLATGTWQRRGRATTPFELTADPTGLKVALAGQSLALRPDGCRVALPTAANDAAAPQESECADFLTEQATLGAWLWLLARGPDRQFDVQVETLKLATERGEADAVLFSAALRSRVRLVLTAGESWLRLDPPDSRASLVWSSKSAELQTAQNASFLFEASAGKARAAEPGWLWIPMPESKEISSMQQAAERSRTLMDGYARFRLLRQDGKLVFAQLGAPVDATPDGVQIWPAPPPRAALGVLAMKHRQDLPAVLARFDGPEVQCLDLAPKGRVPGTDLNAVVVLPCDGPAGAGAK